jgi:hypothetical protein
VLDRAPFDRDQHTPQDGQVIVDCFAREASLQRRSRTSSPLTFDRRRSFSGLPSLTRASDNSPRGTDARRQTQLHGFAVAENLPLDDADFATWPMRQAAVVPLAVAGTPTGKAMALDDGSCRKALSVHGAFHGRPCGRAIGQRWEACGGGGSTVTFRAANGSVGLGRRATGFDLASVFGRRGPAARLDTGSDAFGNATRSCCRERKHHQCPPSTGVRRKRLGTPVRGSPCVR